MLAISDVFILPSETESFGLVALEAMASKTAIISTNSGGLNEVNIEGITGYLSDVGNVNKMANDTLKLLNETDAILLVTGAGMSVDSGIPTYRGANGIWTKSIQIGDETYAYDDPN